MHGDHRALVLLEDLHHLLHAGHRAVDDVVAEHDREGLVAHEVAGHEHRVAEAQGLPLAHVGDVDHVGDGAHLLEQVRLAALLQQLLQLVGDVEVVLDRVLAAAGDDDDVGEARRHRLLDHVLDDRLVDEGQHLLGLRLGGGEEARAQAGGGEDGLADASGIRRC